MTRAHDPQYEPETSSALALFALCDQQEIALIIPHSVKTEIEHRNTPELKWRRARQHIHTTSTNLPTEEARKRMEIHMVLTGKGKPENMAADAQHIFEAQKYGIAFVTVDDRLLRRRDAIARVAGVAILRPSEMLARIKDALASWDKDQ